MIEAQIHENDSNELVPHDFENAKNKIKKFSDTLPKTTKLPSVRGGNNWYGTSVKVTGDDLNDFSEKLTDSLIEQNKNIITVFKEFKTIYDTFDTLDKDYIQRILVNLKATEEANRKALLGIKQNKELGRAQETILKVLTKHKEELDNLKHLKEIDEFYDKYKSFESYQEENIDTLQKNQKNIYEKIYEAQKTFNDFAGTQEESVQNLIENINKVSDKQISMQKEIFVFHDTYNNYVSDQKEVIHILKDDQEKQLNKINAAGISIKKDLSLLQEKHNEFVLLQEEYNLKNDAFNDQITSKLKNLVIIFGIIIIIMLLLNILLIGGIL
ncbi:hypothetical protein [Weissella koreensis]|uniref:Uncharacterized protein n=1 Tax=Weissella koreensis TaxID=165096 RepID=A0A7H1MKZ5_9LACO|nr:hypothetical protein [Weissella koreensis]AVH74928.1 hypothetical protein C4597_02370 [Weissella koreensis]QGN20152.1 hypothetical protein GKC51_02345 [Weissella koreensis]QNT64131.1 hypothetical protein FY536_02070 [Weissella koreensis]